MLTNDLGQRRVDEPSSTNVDERLVSIFEVIFPDLPAEEIRTASVDMTEQWDSLQSVVLVTVLEQEFGISISPLDLPELASYVAIREYLLTEQSS